MSFMRDADEQDICAYLKLWRGHFISAAEICRRAATRKRFDKDNRWAYPVLERLVEQKIVESDTMGHYRYIVRERKVETPRPLSPEIRAILERSGKQFDGVIEVPTDEET